MQRPDLVELEQRGPVRYLTLNRPEKVNALSPDLIVAIVKAVEDAEADRETRVLVLRGSGPGFSAGYDLSEGVAPATQQADIERMLGIARSWGRVWECSIPTIAQVHGWCLAGGTDLALHCDLVVTAADARIGMPPVRSMGVPPTQMWLYHVGPQWTKRLMLTGDTITGDKAAEIGFALASYPAEVLLDRVEELADRIALIGRDLLAINKWVVNQGLELMGRSTLQRISAVQDGIGHATADAHSFWDQVSRTGLRSALTERDQPFAAQEPLT